MTTVVRITVSVADLDAARRLYVDAFGLTLSYELPGIAMLVADGGIEIQLHRRTPTPGDAGVAISFGVTDVDAATRAAVNAGASVVSGPTDQPWGERQSVLRDVDGHVVCVVAPI